jgi:hypothetical protein
MSIVNKALLVFFIAMYSCSQSERNSNVKISINEGATEIAVQHFPDVVISSDHIDKIRFLPLETTEKSLISDIKKILQIRDTLVVMSGMAEISVFAFKCSDGSFLHTFGRKGRGPGEYKSIIDVSFHPETGGISILDETGKVLIFSLKGDFIKQINNLTYPSNFVTFANGDMLISYQQIKRTLTKPYMQLVYLDSQGKEQYRAFSYKADRPFSTRRNSFTPIDGAFYYLNNLSDTIYYVDNLGPRAEYYIDFGIYQLEESKLENIDPLNDRDVKDLIVSLHSSKKCFQIREFYKNSSGLAFLYSYGGFIYLAIGNVIDGLVGGQSYLVDSSLSILPTLVGCTENEFILYQSPEYFMEQCEKSPQIKKEYYEISTRIDELSNPLVIFLKLK